MKEDSANWEVEGSSPAQVECLSALFLPEHGCAGLGGDAAQVAGRGPGHRGDGWLEEDEAGAQLWRIGNGGDLICQAQETQAAAAEAWGTSGCIYFVPTEVYKPEI